MFTRLSKTERHNFNVLGSVLYMAHPTDLRTATSSESYRDSRPNSRNSPRRSPVLMVDDLTESIQNIAINAAVDTPKSSRPTEEGSHRASLQPRVLFTTPETIQYQSVPETSVATCARKEVQPNWNDDEYKALINFIMLYTDGKSWPTNYKTSATFWTEAGVFIKQVTGTSHCRSGTIAVSYMQSFKK